MVNLSRVAGARIYKDSWEYIFFIVNSIAVEEAKEAKPNSVAVFCLLVGTTHGSMYL